jgi:integrase
MNATDHQQVFSVTSDPAAPGRIATLDQFRLEVFQHLSQADLLLAQSVAGHGGEWGVWKTSKTIYPGKLRPAFRSVDFAKRLRDFLAKETALPISEAALDSLVEDGVLHLTCLALLLRLAPTSCRSKAKNLRLKPSSLANKLYSYSPKILARAIRRKAERPGIPGLFACLTEDDVRELGQVKRLRIELERLVTLEARGWWSDLPPQPDITRTTNPRGSKQVLAPNGISGEYQPIPDEYLAEIGPRVLWLICDLGPNLLPLLEDLADCLESLDWSGMTKSKLTDAYGAIPRFTTRHLCEHPWIDRAGKPLQPSFPLMSSAKNKDKFEWPPRGFDQLRVLSATLQSAHLFLTLLASAGRIGEVATLPRSCVTTSRDGKDYIRGWTYKLSGNICGDARQWPAPVVLVQALGQQARLATVWSRLPYGTLQDGLPTAPPAHESLWLSLGSGGSASAEEPLGNSTAALQMLAKRVGMDPKPGGINLHPHRFRKTIGRLAGVTLFNSPLVLKRLFGHKSIEMTLHYILCDPDIRTEAEAVLRELRILHCAEMLEEVRDALAKGAPLPGHSGASAPRLVEAVKEHEARLATSGRLWKDCSAYDLAYMMTVNGQAWRFCQKDIICTKVPGEKGCDKQKSSCKPDCGNRIVLALKQRDALEVAESYLDVARQARDDEQHLVFYAEMLRFREQLETFPDIKAQYLSNPEVQALLALCEELPQ